MNKLYPGVIFRETDGFSITFPDVHGAHSEGDTLAECIAMGQEVLNAALEMIAKEKGPMPEPSDASTAKRLARKVYPEGTVLTVQFVAGTVPGRAQKYTISMDEELMKRVDAAAGKYGRSSFLAEAARSKLAGGSPPRRRPG